MKNVFIVALLISTLASWKTDQIKLEKKIVLNGKVEILLPKDFGIMPEEMLKFKYPRTQRPTLVYSDEDGKINVAFNHSSSKATQQQMDIYKDYFISAFKNAHPNAEWLSNGVKKINGRDIGYLELITQAIDTKIYNLIFYTDLDGHLLLTTFNCTIGEKEKWFSTAHQIMNSLTLNEQ
ncbi:MAG: hypothetical protein ABIW47_00865 [Ginsengibacter sp.]|jgi:hypothetical protein